MALLTSQVVVNELLDAMINKLGFSNTMRHEWDDEFGVTGKKKGDTITLRDPVRLIAVKSATLSLQTPDEKGVTLSLNTQAHTGFSFTQKELTLTIDRFRERYLDEAARALANQIDVDGLTLAYQNAAHFVGVPGTIPTLLETYGLAGAWLSDMGAPVGDGERFVALSPRMEVKAITAAQGLFNQQAAVGKQYISGQMMKQGGFTWYMDQNVRTHTTGPYGGTPAVSGANQVGTSILTSGWTGAVARRLNKGDIISFPGCYAVSPVSGDTLQDLAPFVVTTDFDSLVDGTGTISIGGYGPNGLSGIITSGPYKTCSASPASGALINIHGAAQAGQAALANLTSPQALAYHRSAMTLAMAKFNLPRGTHFAASQFDPETGCAVTIVSDFDITNYRTITRCDVLYGWAVTRPEWIVRVQG